MKTKKCNKCGFTKNSSEFTKRQMKTMVGLSPWCGDCTRAYAKSQHKTTHKKKVEKKNEMRSFIDTLKDVPCMDCKEKYHHVVMDFDHIKERGQKEWVISQSMHCSKETLLNEIAKCDIVCSNCHRIRTFNRRVAEITNP